MSTTDFNQTVVNNADFLKPFAIRLTRDMESAKDLFQETLYRALVNKDKFNADTNIKAWLYIIMRNIFINQYRRKAKQRVILNKNPGDPLADLNEGKIANRGESNIILKDIQKTIHDLPIIFRYPFQFYYDGFKYQEIAQILNEPLGTIKSRIHFARKLLKKQIQM